MWILVVVEDAAAEKSGGALDVLGSLGCRVQIVDAREPWPSTGEPPAVVLFEAGDSVAFARERLPSAKKAALLARVPTIAAVTVRGLSQLDAADGFDDLVLMPYVPAELYHRVRRAEWQSSEFRDSERIKIGPLMIDCSGHEVTNSGVPVPLTQQEFALLVFLAERRGRVFSRDELLTQVWHVDYFGGDRTVDIHIRRLRQKLGTAANPIETVRGVGYKMRQP